MEVFFFIFMAMTVVKASVESEIYQDEWKLYKLKNYKHYPNRTEDKNRMAIWLETKSEIAKHNTMFYQGNVTFTLKSNEFSDMTYPEFLQITADINFDFNLNLNSREKRESRKKKKFIKPNIVVPDYVDWRKDGAVTPVKHQGHCNSCWAFSATGSLEGQIFRKTGMLVPLSEQFLIDCVSTRGCEKFKAEHVFNYVHDKSLIDTEQNYPYDSFDGIDNRNCRHNPEKSIRFETELRNGIPYVTLPRGDEQALKIAVATIGPISTRIVSSDKFQNHEKGIFDCRDYIKPKNDEKIRSHALLIVGYGTDSDTGLDYWLVKNSWGINWGEEGYVRIARNDNNQCSIATRAVYPLIV